MRRTWIRWRGRAADILPCSRQPVVHAPSSLLCVVGEAQYENGLRKSHRASGGCRLRSTKGFARVVGRGPPGRHPRPPLRSPAGSEPKIEVLTDHSACSSSSTNR